MFAPPPRAFSRSHVTATVGAGDLPDSPGTASSSGSHTDSQTAELGQYSLSLKGIRKTLRRTAGGRSHQFVSIAESQLVEWLAVEGRIPAGFYHSSTAGRVLDPTPMLASSTAALGGGGEEVPAVVELSKSPAGLVWRIADPFDRYVLHALCRYYRLQSSSHEEPGSQGASRLTRIWRPHVVRPSVQHALRGIDSPPVTDLSEMGTSASERGATTEGELSELDELTETETETDGEWSQVGGETEQWTEDDQSQGARTRDSSRVRGGEEAARRPELTPSESERSIGPLTDDDAFSVGSAELDPHAVSTDDETDDGGVDSLVSSLASFPPPGTPLRTTTEPALADGASTPLPAFVPFSSAAHSPSGLATPTRNPHERTPRAASSFQLNPDGSIGTATRATAGAGRRTLVRDSSPSRSPQRHATQVRGLLRVRREAGLRSGAGGAGGWEWPGRTFEEFLYARH